MRANRSIPSCTVIPELAYRDVGEAAAWLCDAFGFKVRLRIGGHRVQLNVGDGAVVAVERRGGGDSRSSVLVRVADVNSHHARAAGAGAVIAAPPADHPYGERQYAAEDLAGHRWTFSETLADIAPEAWGGESGAGLG